MKRRMGRCGAAGQALPLMALVVPVVTLLLMAVLELGSLLLTRAQLADALHHSVRAVVQQLDYVQLAQGSTALRGTACAAVTQATASADCLTLLAPALAVLQQNLAQQELTASSAQELTAAARWTVLPDGGACAQMPASAAVTGPLVCVELTARVRSPFGLHERELRLWAAETLEMATLP